MGNYNLKSGIFRCDNCYSIYQMSIEPGLPESFVNLDCKCSTSRTSIKNFLSELSKSSKDKLKCVDPKCKIKDEKNLSYCHDCDHIYCNKCLKKDHEKHKYISLIKSDFYCIFHQKENFCAYCRDCEINLCQKCIENKTHLNHDMVEFNKILMNKTERDFLKYKFNLVQEKIAFNNNLVNTITKKMNKNDAERIINLGKDNAEQNKIILELINFFIYLYDNTKLKNYNIIHNFIENVNLNVNKFKMWNASIKIEEVIEKLINYFTYDFIVVNPNEKENLYETDTNNDQSNKNEEQIKDNIKKTKIINPEINNKFNDIKSDKKNNINNKNKNDNIIKSNQINIKNVNNQNEKNNTKTDKENREKQENDIISNKKEKINEINKIINSNDNKKEKEKENEYINKNKKMPILIQPKREEKNLKKEPKEKINENIIKKNKQEKVEKIEEAKEEIKEEIKEEKNENKTEKEENNIENNGNEYINFLSVNRFRNKQNSIINLMMVNGYRKKKVFDIHLN